MPDWSYRTVFQPVLFRLPFVTARGLALGSMGRLARLPGGTRIIELMGHMAPDERLRTEFAGRTLASPLMLGSAVDPDLTALPALARFGFGMLEIGPLGIDKRASAGTERIDAGRETHIIPADHGALDATTAARVLTAAALPRDSIVVRLAEPFGDDAGKAVEFFRQVIARLSPVAGSFSLPLTMIEDADAVERIVSPLVETLDAADARLLVVADVDRGEGTASGLAAAGIAAGADGVIVDVTQTTAGGDVARGPDCREPSRRLTRSLRTTLGPDVPIIAGGGVHEPADAVRLIADGATMVQIDSGLIFTGPGLPKRVNDALLCYQTVGDGLPNSVVSKDGKISDGLGSPSDGHSRPGRQAWFWTLLMGIAMLLGGALAMVIAITRVVMPYDESFVGMTRDELAQINDRLLLFMTHDRVTLSGTMLAVGLLYTLLSWCGIRRGWHWAQVAVIASAFVGFFTFFLFLGFGYFDPLHAFVTAVLFQFLLLGVHADSTRPAYDDVPNLSNHAAWRRSQWGQLLYVVHGAMLIAAGAVICSYGVTSVFVPEDLEFMQTTAEALCAANPQLVPLVAHDRATFGGMLVACGITVLLASLWGFRQGNVWLWWALFAGGNVAYIATILVHWSVGYTSLKHLLPAYGGLLAIWIGSTTSRRFLCETDHEDRVFWQELTDVSGGG